MRKGELFWKEKVKILLKETFIKLHLSDFSHNKMMKAQTS